MARWDSTAGKCSVLHRSITLSCFGRFPLVILLHRHHLLPPTHFFSVNSLSLAFCFSSYKIFRHFLHNKQQSREQLTDDLTLLSATFPVPSWNCQKAKGRKNKKCQKKDSWDESLLSSSSYAGEEEKMKRRAGLYITLGHIREHILPFSFFLFLSPQPSTKRASSLAQLMAN